MGPAMTAAGSDDPGRVAAAAALLTPVLGERLRRDVPLAPMTTYRVGGPAALFVDVRSLDDLAAVAAARHATGVPVLVVGRGSNMLVADAGFRGLALSIAELAHHVELPDGTAPERVVTAGGGVALPVLARRTAAAGIAGFEWAVGVPGSVGGAVRMNAGGHGSDMAAVLLDVRVFDMDRPGAGLVTLPAASIGLRFRASSLASAHIVHDVRLGLRAGDRARSEEEISAIVQWRREHQPGGQNCGSVFVNPVPGEVAAGGLIDALGLRGFRIGTAHVSEKHANFIQATERGTAADVRAVMEEVRRRVADATGHRLRSEVRLVGFDDVDPLSFQDPSFADGSIADGSIVDESIVEVRGA
jgi:UDP-N-acetylmuramate dehydrogenase